MKHIKMSVLAFSILAGIGSANASTIATFSAIDSGGISGVTTQALTGSGILDSSGSLTLNLTGTVTTSFGAVNITATTIYSGAIANNVFTPDSGSVAINTCVGSLCSFLASSLNIPAPFTTAGGTLNLLASGGTLNASIVGSGSTQLMSDALTRTSPPPVPVPAAAWLFGSGLLGLGGVIRRRA